MLGIKINFKFNRNIVNNKIKGLSEATNSATYETGIATLEDIQASWSSNSPSNPNEPPAVDTGELSSSGTIEDKSAGVKSIYVVGFSAKYAFALEYGKPNLAPRPYIKPALLRNQKLFMKTMKMRINTVL